MTISGRDKFKLLEPGWAGELTQEELEYIIASLKADSVLKQRWGFVIGHRRISEKRVKQVAMDGVPSRDESD